MNASSLRAVPAVMLLLLRFFSLPLGAATHTWKGGGGNNYWSNEDNWTGGAPDDDEGSFIELIFPASAQSYHTVCDLSYFDVERMVFRGSYTVSHTDNDDDNEFGISQGNLHGLVMDSATPRTVTFDNTTKFEAPVPITMTSGTLKFQGQVHLDGLISGSGDVHFEGLGLLDGNVRLNGVTMHMKAAPTSTQVNKFVVGTGATLSVEVNHQINGSEVQLDDGLLTLAPGVADTAGAFSMANNASVNALGAGSSLQFNGTVTCPAGSNYLLGHFLLGGKTREFNLSGGAAQLTISGALEDGVGLNGAQVVTTGGIKKAGPGIFRVNSAGAFHGPVIVSAGDLQASNSATFGADGGNVSVEDGGTLSLHGINVTGETLTLGGRLFVAAGTNSWTGNIVLTGTADRIKMNPAPEECYLKHTGIMSGPGTLGLEGGGALELAGAGSNSFTGETVLTNGVIHLNKSSGNAIPGPLTIDPYLFSIETAVVLDADHQIANDAMILLEGSAAILDLASHNETIGGLLSFSYGAGEVRMGKSRTASATFTTGANNLSTSYAGTITGAPGMTFAKTGTGTFTMKSHTSLLANTYTGETRVLNGTLLVDLNQEVGEVVVKPGATLSGQGKTGAVILEGGNLATSHLNTENLFANASGGNYFAGLFGPAAQFNGYDQVRVTGTVNLTNSTLFTELGFTPVTGAKFVIIQNDGSDAVTGRFTGLPEGGNLNIGGKPFSITYQGGDGNDVELRLLGAGGKPRILTISYNRALDKVHLEALAPPEVLCYWQVSSTMRAGTWSNFASGVSDSAGLLKLDQTIGLQASRLYFRLLQP